MRSLRQLHPLLLVPFQATDVTSDMDETLKSSLTRLNNVENDNHIFQHQHDRLTQEKAALGTQMTQENADLNKRLTHEIADDINEIKQEISA